MLLVSVKSEALPRPHDCNGTLSPSQSMVIDETKVRIQQEVFTIQLESLRLKIKSRDNDLITLALARLLPHQILEARDMALIRKRGQIDIFVLVETLINHRAVLFHLQSRDNALKNLSHLSEKAKTNDLKAWVSPLGKNIRPLSLHVAWDAGQWLITIERQWERPLKRRLIQTNR